MNTLYPKSKDYTTTMKGGRMVSDATSVAGSEATADRKTPERIPVVWLTERLRHVESWADARLRQTTASFDPNPKA